MRSACFNGLVEDVPAELVDREAPGDADLKERRPQQRARILSRILAVESKE
jgi:hypothetical protein